MILSYITGFIKYILSIFGFIGLYILCFFVTFYSVSETNIESFLGEKNLIPYVEIFSLIMTYTIMKKLMSFFQKLKNDSF